MYDFLIRGDGFNFVIVLGSNFCLNNYDVIYEMLFYFEIVMGLSDVGVYVNFIFDGVVFIY